tara:strand:+ start:2250 stop:3245 length:996 start_codon:yes stop_codon:yes gene_type:complete
MISGKTLIIGSSGTIGTKLSKRLSVLIGNKNVINTYHKNNKNTNSEYIDITNIDTIFEIFKKNKDISDVWNLAAPLSIDAENNPEVSYKTTVCGMDNLLTVMTDFNTEKLCFSDSIGSFGSSAPKNNVKTSWLVGNPYQDPGSEYGKQKKLCRKIMNDCEHIDTRFAVIPGVLHSDSSWSNGTTEYALEAIDAYINNVQYVCPIEKSTKLPMIWIDDLIDGLISLQLQDKILLKEPENGYAFSGFSFTPEELYNLLMPTQEWVYKENSRNEFANMWPNSLSEKPCIRDLKWEASTTFEKTIQKILVSRTSRLHLQEYKQSYLDNRNHPAKN